MATTFSGILSRKAGRTMNMNQSAAAQVSNPEVEVAVLEAPAPKPRRTSPTRQEAKAELRSRAQDVTPMAAPEPQEPAAPAPATKAENPKHAAKPKGTKAKAASEPKEERPKAERPNLTMVQYSAKCLALFGDTKPIREQLKKMGGRYNPNLHPFGQATSVPGWVFPMKCEDELRKLVG